MERIDSMPMPISQHKVDMTDASSLDLPCQCDSPHRNPSHENPPSDSPMTESRQLANIDADENGDVRQDANLPDIGLEGRTRITLEGNSRSNQPSCAPGISVSFHGPASHALKDEAIMLPLHANAPGGSDIMHLAETSGTSHNLHQLQKTADQETLLSAAKTLQSPSKRKRKDTVGPYRDGIPEQDQPDELERNNRYGKKRENSKDRDVKGRKLACPYFKHNPRTEGRPVACLHPGFTNVARLKEHLYRIHILPIECPRCYERFDSEQERTEHLSKTERCMEQPQKDEVEGFDKEQELKLRSKKRSKGDGGDKFGQEEKWRGIFMILFPHVPEQKIPSPYVEIDIPLLSIQRSPQEAKVLDGFESFSSQEMPRVVEKLRKNPPMGQMDPSQVLQLLQACQTELISSFRQTGQYRTIVGQGSSPDGTECASPILHTFSRSSSMSSQDRHLHMASIY